MVNNTNLAFKLDKNIFDYIPNQKDFNITYKINILELDKRYQGDTWDISNWPEYENWTKTAKGRIIKNIHFEFIENQNVKNEIKFFMASFILKRRNITIGTIRKYSDTFKKLNTFIENLPFELNSLLEINIQTIIDTINKQYGKGITGLSIFLNQYFEFYKEIYGLVPKFNKQDDIWNLDYIGFKVNYVDTSPVHTLDFSSITIPDFNKAAKTVLYHFLPTKSMSVIKSYRIAFMHLNNYLKLNTNVKLLKDLNRNVIENFIAYLRENFSPENFNNILSGLNICFETLRLLNYDMPHQELIYKFDFTKVVRQETVKVLSDNELKQINIHMNEMEPIHRNILFVFEQLGTRISETLTLKKNYLIKRERNDGETVYSLNYLQHKTNKLNCIPIDELTAEIIIQQIKNNEKEYGENCEYVFTLDGKKPIQYMTFKRAFEKLIENNDILSDDGTPLSKKTHIFRATRATNLANRGISYDTIRLMLGHANMNSLYHYIKIHSQTMSDVMKPIFDEMTYNYENRNNKLIEDVNTVKEEMLQNSPLVNGMCCKNPLEGCEHSNICYTCDFFKGNKKYLQVYENQLTNARNSLEMARLNKFTRIIEQNETLINGLERIIKEIKES